MKYFSKKVHTDEGTFDSKAEYYRWCELLDMQRKGEIEMLRKQVRMEILPAIYRTVTVQLKTKTKTVRHCVAKRKFYTADFIYLTKDHGYIEDVKSQFSKHIRDWPLRKHLILQMVDRWNEGDCCPLDGRGALKKDYWQFKEVVR